jgi:hypothetical protein
MVSGSSFLNLINDKTSDQNSFEVSWVGKNDTAAKKSFYKKFSTGPESEFFYKRVNSSAKFYITLPKRYDTVFSAI